jgi:NADH-quinone oxidoreductase subunit N
MTLFYVDAYMSRLKANFAEFPLIIAFSIFFMLCLISSFNLFGAYVCLEGVSFSLYILSGFNFSYSQVSIESSIKYFCLGVLSSGILLFGVALIFLQFGTLDFVELRHCFNYLSLNSLEAKQFFFSTPLLRFALIYVFFGFWFKLSLFPCHL